MTPELLRLYVILDPEHCGGRPLLEVARAALTGGATALQLRAKHLSDRQRLALAASLIPLVEAYGASFFMNDRVDLARLSGAHGVHLGPQDVPIFAARRIFPSGLVGGSAPSIEVAQRLQSEGADYLGIGALFEARAVKAEASAPRGTAWVKRMREAVSIPIVGIGGITVETAQEVVAAGADGVAVIRAVGAAPDPRAAAEALRAAVEDGLRASPGS